MINLYLSIWKTHFPPSTLGSRQDSMGTTMGRTLTCTRAPRQCAIVAVGGRRMGFFVVGKAGGVCLYEYIYIYIALGLTK